MRVCLVMILMVATGASAAPRQQPLSLSRHIVGGLIGTTLGFGFGHRIQERYWHGAGWGFSLSEIYALFALDADLQSDKHIALYSLLALKVAETISVWIPTPSSKPRSITPGRYVAGGLIGTTLGLGSGHLLQGRWLSGGWPYTVSQAFSLYMIGAPCETCEDSGAFSTLPLTGIALFLASKVLETISLWSPLPSEYRVAATDVDTTSTVTLAPIVQGRGMGLLLAKAL